MTTHPHLQRLAAQPRPVGSDANAAARRYCRDQLEALGFVVNERPFEFSALSGRHGAQIIGAIALVGYTASTVLASEVAAAVTCGSLVIAALWLNRKNATRGMWLRERGVNLEAIRIGAPRVWLVAHIDSKSQPISSAMRSVAALCLIGGALAWMAVGEANLRAQWIVAAIGGLGLMMTGVGSKGTGAADNASGVAAVLDAAALVSRETALGVLITDAEELALAGATAWVHGATLARFVINCDTIDDPGRFVVFRYGRHNSKLMAAAAAAINEVDAMTRVKAPPFGILTDSNVFKRAGWPTVTLARGTLRTLNRIHTRNDSLDSMRGTGIPDAARMLARIVEELA